MSKAIEDYIDEVVGRVDTQAEHYEANGQKRQFTTKEIQNFIAYENIRKSGEFNMWDQRARIAAGLSRSDFLFIISNYSELRDAAIKQRKILNDR